MKRTNEAHAIYSVCLKAFCELKKRSNSPISLAQLEALFPKRADRILTYMQEKMYAGGNLFHGTTTNEGGIGWYLQPHIYVMNTAEYIEYYKQHNQV